VSATHLAFSGIECVGYITLATSTVLLFKHERPIGATVGTLPALLVAQLAVSITARGQGVGASLLEYAAGVAQSLRHQVGCRYLAVDCDPTLVSYYTRYGFMESAGEKHRRESRAKSSATPPSNDSRRLYKDLLREDWCETAVAPPHLRMTALHRSARDDDVSMMNALLNAGASPDLAIGRGDDGLGSGARPIHIAVARSSIRAIEALLVAGAAIDATDGDCETPLHWAVRHGRATIVRFLLDRGANPNLEGGNALFTPLDYAVHGGHVDIAQMMRDVGGTHSESWLDGAPDSVRGSQDAE
jgi:N-acetylglutamate synthase-like GNAT family acetyltransferase